MKKIEQEQTQESSGDDRGQSFEVDKDNCLYRRSGPVKNLVSNFNLLIKSQAVLQDEEMPGSRSYEILFRSGTKEVPFTISSDDFLTRKLPAKIAEVVGSSAILHAPPRDLQIATQKLSGEVPERIVRSRGLTPEGLYLCESMIICPSGIITGRTEVIPGNGGYSKNLGFLYPDQSRLIELAEHIHGDFLELKPHRVTYPLIGHVSLAPFASAIRGHWGMDKPALHLEGPSGGGKSFMASSCMASFGDFGGQLPPWKSTPNAIEAQGFQFRDALFVLDDFKQSIIPQQTAVRVLQGYSGEQGRDRLSPSSRLLKAPYIRGLLLSTGEDFVLDTESVTGRVIRIQVNPEKNLEAGRRCLARSKEYRMFLPSLIQMVIAEPEWEQRAKELVTAMVDSYIKEAEGLPNGLRAAGNWALNGLGFTFFLRFLEHLRVIEKAKREDLWKEYDEIVRNHLQEQALALQLESPVEIFFRVITERKALGSICIRKWNGDDQKVRGKVIGVEKKKEVMLFPDAIMEILFEHYRAVGQRLPFSKNSLRDALARDGLISQSGRGRYSVQFRGRGGLRYQGWCFDLETFKNRIEV